MIGVVGVPRPTKTGPEGYLLSGYSSLLDDITLHQLEKLGSWILVDLLVLQFTGWEQKQI